MNNRGNWFSDNWGSIVLAVLGLVILFSLFFISLNSIGGWDALKQQSNDFLPIADLEKIPNGFNFLTYIIGGIPSSLITEVGEVSAFIVIFIIFIMLALTFGDVLSKFGAYSIWVGWILGILLAVVGANLKFITLLAVISFGMVAGFGALSVAVGLVTPFIIFAVAHFMILRTVTNYLVGKKNAAALARSTTATKDFVKFAKDVHKELTSP